MESSNKYADCTGLPAKFHDPKWMSSIVHLRSEKGFRDAANKFIRERDLAYGTTGDWKRISGGGHEVWSREDLNSLRELYRTADLESYHAWRNRPRFSHKSTMRLLAAIIRGES